MPAWGRLHAPRRTGYTMLTAFSSYVINPALFERIPYDPSTTSIR